MKRVVRIRFGPGLSGIYGRVGLGRTALGVWIFRVIFWWMILEVMMKWEFYLVDLFNFENFNVIGNLYGKIKK